MSTAEVLEHVQNHWQSARPHVATAVNRAADAAQGVARHWKVIGFNLLVLPALVIIYWTINSIGLRLTFPVLSFKVYKIPGFAVLRMYQGWKDLDLANVTAMGLLFFVWLFAVLMMHIFVYGGFRRARVNERFVNSFIATAGMVLVIIDAVMFYNGMNEQGSVFGNGEISVMQVVLTIGYSTALLGVAFVHTLLENH
jgi:hypothetical protein